MREAEVPKLGAPVGAEAGCRSWSAEAGCLGWVLKLSAEAGCIGCVRNLGGQEGREAAIGVEGWERTHGYNKCMIDKN